LKHKKLYKKLPHQGGGIIGGTGTGGIDPSCLSSHQKQVLAQVKKEHGGESPGKKVNAQEYEDELEG
jgi:hypothetical protein